MYSVILRILCGYNSIHSPHRQSLSPHIERRNIAAISAAAGVQPDGFCQMDELTTVRAADGHSPAAAARRRAWELGRPLLFCLGDWDYVLYILKVIDDRIADTYRL
jgi:hypothetical protein